VWHRLDNGKPSADGQSALTCGAEHLEIRRADLSAEAFADEERNWGRRAWERLRALTWLTWTAFFPEDDREIIAADAPRQVMLATTLFASRRGLTQIRHPRRGRTGRVVLEIVDIEQQPASR